MVTFESTIYFTGLDLLLNPITPATMPVPEPFANTVTECKYIHNYV